MDSQTDVTIGFSQNTMPSARVPKRTRSTPRSRTTYGRKKSRMAAIKTNPKSQIWPLQNGNSQLFDPFPSKMFTRMRYSEVITLNAEAGIPASYLFRCNSVHDPNYTGVGHQPYGHDTLASIYNHYRVTDAIMTVTPTSSYNGIFGVSITDDTSVQGDYDTIRETKGTILRTMQSGGSIPSIVSKWSNKQFASPKEQNLGQAYGNNPQEQSFWHVWVEGTNSTSSPGSIKLLITITYDVISDELKDLGQS